MTTTWIDGTTTTRSARVFEDSLRDAYLVNLARDFGAAFDGSTNDTAAIQAAIDATEAQGGGIVLLPFGNGTHTGLIGKSNVEVMGMGMNATKLTLRSGSNTHSYANYVSPDGSIANAQRVGLSNLYLECNKSGNTSGHGVFYSCFPLSSKATNDVWFDPHNFVRNVYIGNAKQTGVWGEGRSELRLDNVIANRCDQYGFRIAYDSFTKGCTASYAGLTGFYCIETNAKIVDCKAFLCGQITAASGHGFRIYNTTGSIISACIAQDNLAHGFALESVYGAIINGCLADSNSTSTAGSFVGFDFFDVHYAKVEACAATDRRNDGVNTYQTKAWQVRSSTDYSDIDIVHYPYNSAALSAAPLRSTASIGNGMRTRLNGAFSESQEVVAYAATVTPDPWKSVTKVIGALTGTITIAAPANTGHMPGQRLAFVFTQDATGGRAITWNAIYKTTTTVLASGGAATNGQTSSITFEFDGTNWNPIAVIPWH